MCIRVKGFCDAVSVRWPPTEIREQYPPSNLKLGVNTFSWHLQLSALHDLDWFCGSIPRSLGNIFNHFHDVVALEHFAKDDMTTIEPAANSQIRCKILWESCAYLVTTVVMKN